MKTLGFQGFHWRRGWDSNPCAIARKLISSQPRYDHFDTSPYMLTRHTEINAIFSCIRIPVRTGVVLETMECPKTAQLKAFWKIDFRLAKKISSQPRYDHFDISPSMLNSVLEYNDYSIFHRTGRPVMSCCGVRNFSLAVRLAKFRPLPLLIARFICHRQRSQTSPLRYLSVFY